MSKGEIFKLTDFKEDSFDPTPYPSDNKNEKDDGGGPTMRDDYVTHEELHHTEDNLSNKIDNTRIELSGKVDRLADKIAGQQRLLWWIMGIISTTVVVPVVAYVLKLIITK